jgi:hypothetical protein
VAKQDGDLIDGDSGQQHFDGKGVAGHVTVGALGQAAARQKMTRRNNSGWGSASCQLLLCCSTKNRLVQFRYSLQDCVIFHSLNC